MPPKSDWRPFRAASDLNRLEPPGFAQEFLRRNPRYRQDYAHMARRIAAGAVSEDVATADLACRWGLSFPRRSQSHSVRDAGDLAARTGTDRHPADGGAGRL